jgi:hypothetical protein
VYSTTGRFDVFLTILRYISYQPILRLQLVFLQLAFRFSDGTVIFQGGP